VARRLANLEATARRKIEDGMGRVGRKQRMLFKKACRRLGKLIRTAKKAEKKRTLGVPLRPIQETVDALQARLGC
jgi:hypothetical protein